MINEELVTVKEEELDHGSGALNTAAVSDELLECCAVPSDVQPEGGELIAVVIFKDGLVDMKITLPGPF